MNKITMNGYKRITKTQAIKKWNNNETFFIDSCKMIPGNSWGTTMMINAENMQERKDHFSSFDSFLNNFSYYNCDNERGYYPAFYVKE